MIKRWFKREKTSLEDSVVEKEEHAIIEKCVHDGDIVFDLGAFHGEWSRAVANYKDCEIHLFEASPEAFEVLQELEIGNVKKNHMAVSDTTGELTFHVYRDDPRLSSAHRRVSVEDKLLPAGFDAYSVPSISLDDYWANDPRLINFLKIDVEGSEYEVLQGARNLLRRGMIDYIQFEYGGTFADANITLKLVYYFLRRFGYHLFEVKGKKFREIPEFSDKIEDFGYTNFLAVNARHLSRFKGQKGMTGVFFSELESLGIARKGVVHIGAHQGQEVETYRKAGISPVILIEGNPDLADKLHEKFEAAPDVSVIGKAISDRPGKVDFNIASFDQSSSLLRMKRHAELYPKIKFVDKVEVEATTLDACMGELEGQGADIDSVNLLMMDIQGAELMALRGGMKFLEQIDAIQLEVNYTEIYENGPLIWEIDDFLSEQGFVRYKTDYPHSSEWGDALYVRRPRVANVTIGKSGRFGNQIFQYMFLSCHAADHDFSFENSRWDGDRVFNIQPGTENPGAGLQRKLVQSDYTTEGCNILNSADRLANTVIEGFFQYNMLVYRANKRRILDEFSFRGKYGERSRHIASVFENRKKPIVGLHLRRGDYGTGIFYIAPNEWYIAWLERLRSSGVDFALYIASDDYQGVKDDFSGYDLIAPTELGDAGEGPEYFDDFAALCLCDKLAISNSSFSFAASLFNTRADSFMRPDLQSRSLIPYEPWQSEPLLRNETAEDNGEKYMSARAKTRTKYKIRKLKKRFGLG